MKKQIVVLAVIAMISITLPSCENNVAVLNSFPYQIPVWDYSENYYLFDTLYKRSYTDYNNDSITSYVMENGIQRDSIPIEIWEQCNITDPNKRFCVGKVMLGARPLQGYDTSITKPETILGDKFAGYFRRVDEPKLFYNTLAGFVGFKFNIPENYYAGVVYKTNSGQMFGKGEYESNSTDTLIIKLIKIDTPSPELTPLAWQLKMKNVYSIPYINLQPSTTLYLMYNNNNVYQETISGYSIPLITMLKLDKFNNGTLSPPPDGKFDWLPNRTIFPVEGYMMFPILEPFGKGLKNAGVDSTYWFEEIYYQKKIISQQSPKANMYRFNGSAVYY